MPSMLTLLTGLASILTVSNAQPPPWITAGPAPWGSNGPWGNSPAQWAAKGPQFAAQCSSWVSEHNREWASLSARYGANWQSWQAAAQSVFSSWASDAPWNTAQPAAATTTVIAGVPAAHAGWSGPPFNGGWGPYNPSGPWTTGPWTSWWNDANGVVGANGCPSAQWPGWTAGQWSTNPPWTTWSQCVATTTGTIVYTTNVGGVIQTVTAAGVQFAQQTNGITGTYAPAFGEAHRPSLPRATAAVGGALMAGLGVLAAL